MAERQYHINYVQNNVQIATFKSKDLDVYNMSNMPESRYINLRVPRSEYVKLKEVKDLLKNDPKYSWAESLALGALIGLVAGMVIAELKK